MRVHLCVDFFQPNLDWKYSIRRMQIPKTGRADFFVYSGSAGSTAELEYAQILVYAGVLEPAPCTYWGVTGVDMIPVFKKLNFYF